MKDIVSSESAELFETRWPNLLVCFSVGDIFSTLGDYFRVEGLPQEVQGDFSCATLCKATEDAFLTLLNRGALDAFVRVTPLPPAAQEELDRMAGIMNPITDTAADAREVQRAAVAECARDYRSLEGSQFKQKWMNLIGPRSVYDAAICAGVI